jgi:hypothetical protein
MSCWSLENATGNRRLLRRKVEVYHSKPKTTEAEFQVNDKQFEIEKPEGSSASSVATTLAALGAMAGAFMKEPAQYQMI